MTKHRPSHVDLSFNDGKPDMKANIAPSTALMQAYLE